MYFPQLAALQWRIGRCMHARWSTSIPKCYEPSRLFLEGRPLFAITLYSCKPIPVYSQLNHTSNPLSFSISWSLVQHFGVRIVPLLSNFFWASALLCSLLSSSVAFSLIVQHFLIHNCHLPISTKHAFALVVWKLSAWFLACFESALKAKWEIESTTSQMTTLCV